MKKRLRYAWVRFLRCDGAPKEIAGGLAVGLFMGMLPLPGGQMAASVGVAEVLRRLFGKRLSRVGAAAGAWFTNPLTAAPLYGLCWVTGRPLARLVLPSSMLAGEGVRLSIQDLGSAGPFLLEILLGLTFGGILWGIPIAFVGYKLALKAVARYQARKAHRRSCRRPALVRVAV